MAEAICHERGKRKKKWNVRIWLQKQEALLCTTTFVRQKKKKKKNPIFPRQFWRRKGEEHPPPPPPPPERRKKSLNPLFFFAWRSNRVYRLFLKVHTHMRTADPLSLLSGGMEQGGRDVGRRTRVHKRAYFVSRTELGEVMLMEAASAAVLGWMKCFLILRPVRGKLPHYA